MPKSKKTSRRPAVPSSRLQLRYLAHARSGDKGDTANVGLIALEPEYYPILRKEVTRARVAHHFKGMATGVGVELFDGNGERVPLGKRLTFGRSGPVTGDLSMPFTARYYQVAETITPGPMQVPAVLTLYYE